MFGNNIIKNRVMEVIDSKIKATQKAYDEGVIILEQEMEEKKEKLADTLVDDIIGKIM